MKVKEFQLRGKKRFRVEYTNTEGVRRRPSFATKQEASDFIRQYKNKQKEHGSLLNYSQDTIALWARLNEKCLGANTSLEIAVTEHLERLSKLERDLPVKEAVALYMEKKRLTWANKTFKNARPRLDSFVKKHSSLSVDEAREEVLPRADEYYFNEDGLMVLKAKFLLRRGYCCENGCRHCPYSQ